MLNRKILIRFFISVVLLFALFSIPNSFLRKEYSKFYRATATKLFSDFREDGFVRFEKESGKYDSRIGIGNKKLLDKNNSTQLLFAPLSSQNIGYFPTILFVSLLLASPISWKRKIPALLLGLFLTTGIIMFKTWMNILHLVESTPWLKLSTYSDSNKERIEFIYFNFANYTAPSLLLVVVIWVMVSFRRSDFSG